MVSLIVCLRLMSRWAGEPNLDPRTAHGQGRSLLLSPMVPSDTDVWALQTVLALMQARSMSPHVNPFPKLGPAILSKRRAGNEECFSGLPGPSFVTHMTGGRM